MSETKVDRTIVSGANLSAVAVERRAQILVAATACFSRRGFHQTSMQEVCAAAKMSPGSVYRYFASKDDIIVALAESEMDGLRQFFDRLETVGSIGDALDRLARWWTDCFAAFATPGADNLESTAVVTDPDELRAGLALYLEVAAESVRNPKIAALAARYDMVQVDALAQLIVRAQRAGEVAPDLDPPATARLMIATLDGLAMRAAYEPHDPARTARYIAETRAFLKRALGADR